MPDDDKNHLTIGQLRKMIEGVPDEVRFAIQDENDPSIAFGLNRASVDMWGDILVLEHTGDGFIVEGKDDEDEEDEDETA